MRHITTSIAVLVLAGTAPFATADQSRSENAARAATINPSEASNANLLADRHLALYRAVRLPAASIDAAADGDGALATPLIVRTSATAAIPLPPPSQDADGQ